MARSRENTVADELEAGDEPLIMDQEDALQKILAEFGKGDEGVVFTVRVTRVPVSANGKTNQPGAKETFLFDCDQSEVPGMATKLRDVYGSGVYRARIKENNKLIGAIDFHVEAPPGRIPSIQPEGGKSDGLLIQLIEKMDRRIETLQERILAREAVPVAPVDHLALLTGAVSLITTIQGAAPKPENNMIEIFKLGMEMKSAASGGEGETGIMDVLKSLAEKIDFSKLSFPVVQPAAPNPAPRPIQSRPLPQPTPRPQPQPPRPDQGMDQPHHGHETEQDPPPRPAPAITGNFILAPFASQFSMLADKAARGDEPELWADVLDRELPDEAFEFLMKMDNMMLIHRAAEIEPRVTQYRAWFEKLIAALRLIWDNAFEADPEPAVLQPELHDPGSETIAANGNSARRSGNGSNAPADEAVAGQGENLNDH